MDPYRNPYATWIPSPNYWPNRNGHSPMWVGPGVNASWTVLHVTDCTEAAAEATFESAPAQRSAHYEIPKGASLVADSSAPFGYRPVGLKQFVDEGDAAWHSGNGDVNENSDGIEHERTQGDLDGHAPFEPGQLLVSMWLVADLARRRNRPLSRDYVIGHGECHAVEASVFGFGRGETSTACPDDLPVDLILKGAAMFAAGQDAHTLFAPATVTGTVTDHVDGVSVPGRVYQGGTLYSLTSDAGAGVTTFTATGSPAAVGTTLTYTAAVKVGSTWYDLVGPGRYISDDDLDTSDAAHPNGSTPADYRPAPPAPTPAPTPAPAPAPTPAPTPTPEAPPVQNPPVPTVETPPVAEPQPVAEAGITTSEWQVLLGFAAQEAAVGTAAVAAKVNLVISPDVLNAIVAFEFLGAAAAVSYIVGRSIRKRGTAA